MHEVQGEGRRARGGLHRLHTIGKAVAFIAAGVLGLHLPSDLEADDKERGVQDGGGREEQNFQIMQLRQFLLMFASLSLRLSIIIVC